MRPKDATEESVEFTSHANKKTKEILESSLFETIVLARKQRAAKTNGMKREELTKKERSADTFQLFPAIPQQDLAMVKTKRNMSSLKQFLLKSEFRCHFKGREEEECTVSCSGFE